jgi:hypothetical protein
MLRELPLVRHTSTIFYLLNGRGSMVAGAVALRGLGSVFVTGHASRWLVAGLLLIFGVLLATERLLSRRWAWYPHAYLALQTGLIIALLPLPPNLDFFAALGLPLSAQALRALPRPRGFSALAIADRESDPPADHECRVDVQPGQQLFRSALDGAPGRPGRRLLADALLAVRSHRSHACGRCACSASRRPSASSCSISRRSF